MLNYRYSINIDGSAWGKDGAPIYEREIRFLLDGIIGYDSVVAILVEINLSPYTVTIVPEPKPGDAGTGRDPKVDSKKWAADTTPSGSEYLSAGREESGQTVRDSRGQPIFGTGAGSGAQIKFSTRNWTFSDRYGRITPARVLVHELCHAMRKVKGISLNQVTDDHFHNEEEFYAILVENIFVSEGKARGGSDLPLRGTHDRMFVELDAVLADPKQFYITYRNTIKQLGRQMSGFAFALAQVACEFNPLKEWANDPNRDGYEEVPNRPLVIDGQQAAQA